jgi:drug/metabolite transporter (DMT)-like permease
MSLDFISFALVSAILFALALVLTRFGLESRSPLAGASISIPTATLLFVGIAPFTVDFSRWHFEAAALFALAGVFFPVAVTLLTFASNRRLGPTLTGAFGNLTPLFAVGLAVMLVGDVPTPMQWLGITVIVAGVFRLSFDGPFATRTWPLWALLLPIGAALLRGLVQPLVKLGLEFWPNPLVAATIGYVISAAVVLALQFTRHTKAVPNDVSGGWWFVAVGICNGGAVLALFAALARAPVTLVAPLVATYPLAVLLLERAIRGQAAAVRPAELVGTGAIVAGVMILVAWR